MLSITASIIQGSATVSATYVVTAADLRTVFCNSILKYADDTYLIIPGMLSPRHGLGLEAQKNWPRPRNYWRRPRPHDSCGLGLAQLGLVAS